MPAKIATTALSLLLAGCVTTTGTSGACDVHYVGPPPAHYLAAGRALNSTVMEWPSDMVLEQCDGLTPVGCIDMRPEYGWYFVIITNEPQRWNLTRQWIIDHETAHLGGWNYCHNN